MAAPSPLLAQPPNLQQVVQGINNVVAPATRQSVAEDIAAVLAFTIPAGQVLRRIFWSFSKFLMTGTNTKLTWVWDQVPESETRRYLHIAVSEPRVNPAILIKVQYPNQGEIEEDVGMVIASGDTSIDIPDLLSPGQDITKGVYPGLPVEVFPLGRLRGEVGDPLAAGDTVKVFTVWERLAPPNTARAEDDPLTFVEF